MLPSVVIIGLGPGGEDLLTRGTLDVIDSSPRVYLRTARHPAAGAVPGAVSFDHLYERAATFEEVYSDIVEALVSAGQEYGEVVYAVPGSPVVAERTVEMLLADRRVTVRLVPAMSFVDLAWVRLGVDPLAAGARIIDGHRFAQEAAGERGPLLVSQCHSQSVLTAIKLSLDADTDELPPVTVLQRLGLPDEHIVTIAWPELDRLVTPDHLTSLWIPWLGAPVAAELVRLQETMRTLRARCPWDSEQTHQSLARYVVEEAYELAEAIDLLAGADDADEGQPDGGPAVDHLVEELGDVLFQVVFHSCLGEESGRFTLADVARTLVDKLQHRHPHVFGDSQVFSSAEVVRNWERIKAAERVARGHASDGLMDGLSPALPALSYASEVLKRAQAAGHVVPAHVLEASEVGQALLGLVAGARRAGVDPEVALRLSAARLRDDVVSRDPGP